VHGTGASSHSWRGLMPLLARRFTVVAPDLPGHGFTARPAPEGLSLPGMAAALRALMDSLGHRPAVVLGHSAGAAVLLRMALDGHVAPRAVVALNGALLPFGGSGASNRLFSSIARIMVGVPAVPWLVSLRAADRPTVARLLEGTGSHLDAQGIALYAKLFRSPGHVGAALGMMARWDLEPLVRDLPRLGRPLVLVAGTNDRTVAPAVSTRVAALVPGARVVSLAGLGHLAHEERPDLVAGLVDQLPELVA